MDPIRLEQWRRLHEQKCQSFAEEQCRMATRISSIDDLQANIREMTRNYGDQAIAQASQRLQPSLENLRAFVSAISSASQYNPNATLVWGAVQAVIESACKVHGMLDEILGLMSELNDILPHFQEYLQLFQGHPELHWPIQDLYSDYLDYCITVVKYLRSQPSMNIFRYLWTSSPQRELQRTKERIKKHCDDFENEVTLLFRKSVRQQNLDIAKTLNAPMSRLSLDSTSSAATEEAKFPVSTVSLYQNFEFVGREHILTRVKNTLLPQGKAPTLQSPDSSDDDKQPSCVVLHGLGGVGKTQTALEYYYRNKKHYHATFWLPSETDSELSLQYSLIAEKLKLLPMNSEEDQQKAKVQRARDWLENTDRSWLLIFDNTEQLSDLHQYLPMSCRGTASVIITTQKADFFPITKVFSKLAVRSLSRDEASHLMFKFMEREPVDDAEREASKEVSDLVDGLPLAIAAIGGYINQSSARVQTALENLKKSSTVWEASSHVGAAKQYERSLVDVFTIALGELPPAARDFINILAFLDPDNIPEDIFTPHFEKPVFDFLRNQDQLNESIRVLRKRQLIGRDYKAETGGYLTIHRTVQWNVLLDISRDQKKRWESFRRSMLLIRRGCPMVSPLDIPEPEKWPQFQKYVPQVLNIRTHCLWPDPPIEPPSDFAQILGDLATYMWHAGLAEAGSDALHTAIEVYDHEGVEENDNRRSDIYAKLGILLSHNGVSDRKETLKRRLQAWDIRHENFSKIPRGQVTRNDEIRLYNVKCDLAWTWLHEEQFEKAEPIMEECLAKYKEWDTEDNIPFEYAKYYCLMGFVRMWQNKPEVAVRFSRRGADLAEQAAGVGHPMTQIWRFALANISYHAGALQKAWELNEDVRNARIVLCGEFNHFTLESYSTCAILLCRLGRSAEAEELMLKCLERRKRSVWNQEGVARSYWRYSQVLSALGKEEEAQEAYKEAKRAKDDMLTRYTDLLKDDTNEERVYDQMVSLWAGRLTGSLEGKSGTEAVTG